ncbi:hypothetical protein D3C78_1659640 [compost metagenome]
MVQIVRDPSKKDGWDEYEFYIRLSTSEGEYIYGETGFDSYREIFLNNTSGDVDI